MPSNSAKFVAAGATVGVALCGWGYGLSTDVAALKVEQENLKVHYFQQQTKTNERMLDVLDRMDKRLVIVETVIQREVDNGKVK